MDENQTPNTPEEIAAGLPNPPTPPGTPVPPNLPPPPPPPFYPNQTVPPYPPAQIPQTPPPGETTPSPMAESPSPKPPSPPGKKPWLWVLLGIVVLAAAAAAAYFIWQDLSGESGEPSDSSAPPAAPMISVTAAMADETHITPEGLFTVTGAAGIEPDELAERLAFQPEREFTLTPLGAEGSFTLQTAAPLTEGERVVITYTAPGSGALTWEFLVQEAFAVTGVFPADGSSGVPPSSAVEIHFNSEGLDFDTIGDYISVSPEIPGSFTGRGNMAVFIPEERYFPALTTFTVNIAASLPAAAGQTLGEDISFSFTTGVEEDRDFMFTNNGKPSENTVLGEETQLNLSVGRGLESGTVSTVIYQYPDADAYLAALQAYQNKLERESVFDAMRGYYDSWEADVTGLSEVMSFESPLYTKDDYQSEHCVIPPEPLAGGWYAARLEVALPSGGALWAWKFIQVGSFSVYTAQSGSLDDNNSLVAWVNSTETGNAIAGAELSVTASNYSASAATDADGVALLEGKITPVLRGSYGMDEDGEIFSTTVIGILTVTDGDHVFHDLYGNTDGGFYNFNRPNPSNNYYGYLFTDRPIYRHTDTVKVWGVIRPRFEGAPEPQNLKLEYGYGDAYSVPVTPAEDGTFQLELRLEALSGNWMQLRLTDDSGYEYSQWLNLKLEDYVKPEYETTAAAEKPVYTLWDDPVVIIDFTARYFEGTPARDYSAVVRKSETGYSDVEFDEATLTTDAGGAARTSITLRDNNRNAWQPERVPFAVYNTDPLNASQLQEGYANIFLRDTILKLEEGEREGEVRARTNKVDISRIQSDSDLLAEENFTGAATDAPLRAAVYRWYYVKVPNGERYDAVTKQAVTAYDFDYKEEIVATLTAQTVNGEYIFTGLPMDDPNSDYRIEVTATDGQGLPVTESISYFTGEDNRRRDTLHYEFAKRMPGSSEADETEYGTDLMAYSFMDGEQTAFFLSDGFAGEGKEVVDPDGRLFHNLSQDSILEYGVSGMEFTIGFSDRYLPNYILSGAYFDGKHVYMTQFTEMSYKPGKRALSIEITPERESYDPGDTATISFQVTDATTGAPVETTLVAAVVDEAVFALQEQNPDFLNQLYRLRWYNRVYQYTSYSPNPVAGGGMGGGGDEPFQPRREFEDTALFASIRTDTNGVASVQVELPDNLTSWRVTTLALSDHLMAGDNKGSFSVSQDFFVSPVLPVRLIEGDDFVLTLHSAGRSITPEDIVDYSVTIEGQETTTASGAAGAFTPVWLPALPAGDHMVTVSGIWGEERDGLTLPISVVKSGVNVSVSERMALADAAGLSSTSYPVTLGFYDKGYELGAEILSALTSEGGARADQRIAARYVAEQMQASGMPYDQLDNRALTDDFADLCPDWVLYRQFPYSEPDARLTARVMLADPIHYQGSMPYLEPAVPGTVVPPDGDLANSGVSDPNLRAAYYLMRTQYESDSTEILAEELAKSIYSFENQMYLVAAMAQYDSGAAPALEQFQALAAPKLTEQMNADGQPVISAGNHADTAAALLAATAVNAPEAAGLARWLLANPSKDDLYLLELMYYHRQIPAPDTAASVTYQQDGAHTLDLSRGMVYRSFSKAQLEAAVFQASGGDIWVSARYTAGLDEAMNRENQKLQVEKTIEAAGGGALGLGALAKITVRVTVPEDVTLEDYTRITLEDYIPTGMRYDSMEITDTGWYLNSRNDQRISFSVSNEYLRELVFYARCVTPGNYIAESAFASLPDGSLWGVSERSAVEITG